METKIQVYPTGTRVLVKQDKQKETSQGGIILAKSGKEKPLSGTIIRVGPDVKGIQSGMDILFTAYAGTKINDDYIVMEENDIIAVTGDKK